MSLSLLFSGITLGEKIKLQLTANEDSKGKALKIFRIDRSARSYLGKGDEKHAKFRICRQKEASLTSGF